MTSADSILQVSHAFRLLFQDDILNARALLLEKQLVQPYNHLGLAIIVFIEALLGMEEHVISEALEALFKSEQAIKQAKNSLNYPSTTQSNASANYWWSPGLEYDIMLADVLIFQSILHFMTETISDSMKGIYKLTKAYKTYSASHETIFSELEKRTVDKLANSNNQVQRTNINYLDSEISELIDTIQEVYSNPRKQPHASTINSTTSYLTSGLNFLSSFNNRKKITESSDQSTHVDTPPVIYKKWTEDPIASLVIGGSSFGFGLFGLILSFLPPKIMKLLSWVGLNNIRRNVNNNNVDVGNKINQNLIQRNQSIKLLLFSNSSCHWELHARLAGLGLITYRSVMLKTVGWLADPERAIKEYKTLVDSLADNRNNQSSATLEEKENKRKQEENGTLWVVHQSRLLIFQGDINSSKNLITKKIEQIQKVDDLSQNQSRVPPKSTRSIALLIYELALISVRLADWLNAGQAFLSLKKHNSWSHVTYQFAALGCFLLVKNKSNEHDSKIDNLFEELPSLFSKKKSMGRELPPHEMLVNRKLNEYKSKHADLVSKGIVRPDRVDCYWDSIQISPIEELSLLLMTYDDTPKRQLVSGIRRLSSLNPSVSVDLFKIDDGDNDQGNPLSTQDHIEETLGNLKLKTTDNHLQKKSESQIDLSLSREEITMRDLLLGVQLMNLGEYEQAKVFLNNVPNPSSQHQQPHPEKENAEAEEKRDRKGEYINYVNALIYKSLIELKQTDSILSESSSLPDPDHQQAQVVKLSKEEVGKSAVDHQEEREGNSNDIVQLCLSKLRVADSILNSILELQESYHMRSRTESKIQLIKEQINEKIMKLSESL